MTQLTPHWKQLRYHEVQSDLWQYKGPFAAVVATRGGGKSEIAKRKTVSCLPFKKPWPNPLYFYCLPTYQQAKRVAWKPLLNLIPISWIKGYNPKKHSEGVTNKEDLIGVNVSDSCITTIFGSSIYVIGLDKPQRIEGLQFDGGVIDECSDQKPGAFKLSILPTLSHRNPWCWRIGVPKRTGVGRIEFREFFERGLRGSDGIKSFHWTGSSVLTHTQLEHFRSLMSDEDFNEQFNAMWLDSGGTIYYAFSDDNISDQAHYRPELPICVCCDFNVDPMAWGLAHKIDNKFLVFDEVFLRNTNTVASLKHLSERYPEHRAGWRFYGDASANHRKSSTDKTDYIHIKNSILFYNKKVYFFKKNPKVKSRHAHVNAVLCNAKGERRMFVHPRCTNLINDFRLMSYKEGTTEPENYDGTDIGHISDGIGYAVCRLFPMKVAAQSGPNVVTV